MKGYYREPKTRVTPNKKQHQSGPTMDPAIFVRYTITIQYVAMSYPFIFYYDYEFDFFLISRLWI